MILRLPSGRWIMGRDFFRGLLRFLLVICLMASCGSTFYYMEELSKNTSSNQYDSYYNKNKIQELDDEGEMFVGEEQLEQDTSRIQYYYEEGFY